MTNFEVTQRLNELKNEFPSTKFWNHIGSTVNDPSSTTSQPCTHHDSGCDVYGSCDCNCFANALQCHGFAKYMAYRVFGTFPDVTSYYSDVYNGLDLRNGWKLYTNSYVSNIEIEPGDVIRVGTHTAIVHYVRGNEVFVGEVWGNPPNRPDLRCKIAWGYFNDSSSNTTSVLKNNLNFIAKAPKTCNSDSIVGDDVDGAVKIINISSGKCLTVSGTNLSSGNTVTMNTYSGSDGQKWIVDSQGCDIKISSYVDSDYSLGIGTSHICVVSSSDEFLCLDTAQNNLVIRHSSNHNLVLTASSTSEGAKARWAIYNGGTLQQWKFEAV